MWKEIDTNEDLTKFMNMVCSFHDGCIKELKYTSGAYVDTNLSMHPVNDLRRLRIIIQCQREKHAMIELEFEGLKFLNLYPIDDMYTCEILDSSMFFKDGLIYWCDQKASPTTDLENFKGTLICASKLRWRSVENNIGAEEYYYSLAK